MKMFMVMTEKTMLTTSFGKTLKMKKKLTIEKEDTMKMVSSSTKHTHATTATLK